MLGELLKRDPGINMRLVPHRYGWTHVYLDIGEDKLYFIISCAMGHSFTDLLRTLYFLHPENNDPEFNEDGLLDWWDGAVKIAKKSEFTWEEEGAFSHWVIERAPTLDTDFNIKISIDICRDEAEHYEYNVRYQDFCYVVARACTEALKRNGIYGYHYSIYDDDIHLRYLLFIKSVALDNFEARALTASVENGWATSFEKEIELLTFDM